MFSTSVYISQYSVIKHENFSWLSSSMSYNYLFSQKYNLWLSISTDLWKTVAPISQYVLKKIP